MGSTRSRVVRWGWERIDLKILFVAVEVSPLAKVGGLADVAGSLPKALKKLGHDVRIVMPAYQMILDDPRWDCRQVANMVVPDGRHANKHAFISETKVGDVPVYLVGTDEWFTDTVSSDTVYLPGIERYLFFSEAVLALPEAVDWMPDVVHCNDWHTGFVPVLMREKYGPQWLHSASVFTIHNFAYQGEFDTDVLDRLELPRSLYNPRDVEAWGRVNFLKAGCVFSDRVNTVSERYAEEIQTPEFGCRLEGLMQHLSQLGRLSGILNGIDREVFNPSTDPVVPKPFSVEDPSGKSCATAELRKRLNLEHRDDVPVLGVVSRLSGQKGLDLLVSIAAEVAALPAQLVVQGLGDPWLVDRLRELEAAHPARIRFINAFDEEMAQLVYAGSNMFLMPSAFEPCGLGQMIALRYGTIPIVRRTGGLADTIFEGENGFVFANKNAEDFMAALRRAKRAFDKPEAWSRLVQNALKADFGWDRSARAYAELYEKAVKPRRPSNVVEAYASTLR